MSRYAIGVDLGGTKVEACLVDENRKILFRERVPSEPHLGRERVIENILKVIGQAAGDHSYEAVGMGTPGTYNERDDVMHGAPHTPTYEKPGLISGLRGKLSIPLIIENDANCLALAEFFANCIGTYRYVMAVILGTGIGSGLILDNRLYRGALGSAGEIGHASVDIHGRKCECGRIGCGEAYLSGPSLSRRFQEKSGRMLAPREIFALYQQGDRNAIELFEESIRIMGELFANTVNILDLEAIILGGGISNIPLWYEHVGPVMRKLFFGPPRPPIPIIKASLGDSAGVLGAAFLGLRQMGLMEF